MNLCVSLDIVVKKDSHKSHEYQHDLNENLFFSKKLKVRITLIFAVLL